MNIREYVKRFDNGDFHASNTATQCEAGWYDWFCKDTSLRHKTYKLTAKLKQIISSPKINQDTMYVFFKNNCPCYGKLYDDFRICGIENSDVLYTVIPAVGYEKTYGQAEVWGKENDFKEALVAGTWNDVIRFFTGIDKKKEQQMKKEIKAEKEKSRKLLQDEWDVRGYLIARIEALSDDSDLWYEFQTVKLIKIFLALTK